MVSAHVNLAGRIYTGHCRANIPALWRRGLAFQELVERNTEGMLEKYWNAYFQKKSAKIGGTIPIETYIYLEPKPIGPSLPADFLETIHSANSHDSIVGNIWIQLT